MSGQKNIWITFGIVLSVSMIASALTAMLVSFHGSRRSFAVLNGVFGEMLAQEPETEQMVLGFLSGGSVIFVGGSFVCGDFFVSGPERKTAHPDAGRISGTGKCRKSNGFMRVRGG